MKFILVLLPTIPEHQKPHIYRYTSSAATGYVAEVRYEGTPVFPGVVGAPQSEKLRRPSQGGQAQRRPQQGGRPINKRNENSTPAEFNEEPLDVELKFFSDTN